MKDLNKSGKRVAEKTDSSSSQVDEGGLLCCAIGELGSSFLFWNSGKPILKGYSLLNAKITK